MGVIELLRLPVLRYSQERKITVDQAVEISLRNNHGLKASAKKVDQSKQLIGTAIDISKTELYYNKDQNNIAPNNTALQVWGISQSLQFPTVYTAQRKVMIEKSRLANDQYAIDRYMVTKEVSQAYYKIVYWQQMRNNYQYLDSLYKTFEHAATRKFEQGESNYLEKLTAETKRKEISLQLNQIKENIEKSLVEFNQWLQS